MIYLFNTNLPNEKKVTKALEKIQGIGRNQSHQICNQLGISNQIRINQLSNQSLEKLTGLIQSTYQIGSDLTRIRSNNIARLVRIGSYRGFRHTEGLPVHGQRTHGNANTCRKLRQARFNLVSKISKQNKRNKIIKKKKK